MTNILQWKSKTQRRKTGIGRRKSRPRNTCRRHVGRVADPKRGRFSDKKRREILQLILPKENCTESTQLQITGGILRSWQKSYSASPPVGEEGEYSHGRPESLDIKGPQPEVQSPRLTAEKGPTRVDRSRKERDRHHENTRVLIFQVVEDWVRRGRR